MVYFHAQKIQEIFWKWAQNWAALFCYWARARAQDCRKISVWALSASASNFFERSKALQSAYSILPIQMQFDLLEKDLWSLTFEKLNKITMNHYCNQLSVKHDCLNLENGYFPLRPSKSMKIFYSLTTNTRVVTFHLSPLLKSAIVVTPNYLRWVDSSLEGKR